MADTALTLITDALLDLGVLADEETPSASQAQGGLRKLNNLLDSWNIENLMVYGAQSYTIPLVSGQASYTIGTGGNLNIPRPTSIQSAYVRDLTLPVAQRLDYPLYMYTNQEWSDVAFKGQTASWPNWGVWFDDSYPLINAYVNPVPNTSQYGLVIWIAGDLANLDLNDVISLAPGYKRAIVANLAIEMAPSYQVEPSAAIVEIARQSKSLIKSKNFQLNELQIDPRLTGAVFDYRTGYYK